MKTLNPIYIALLILGAIVTLFSCEESEEFERYVPSVLEDNDSTLIYTDLETYPYLDLITTDTPTVNYSGKYSFVLDSIVELSGVTFQRNKFNIDRNSGVIRYNNGGELTPGQYVMNVGLVSTSGIVIFKEAFTMDVKEVPVTLSIDNAVVDAGALQVGTIAQLSITDNSGGEVTEVKYAFTEAKDGFAIDGLTGEISKTGSVLDKTTTFSIKVTTNLGAKVYDDVLVVNVGEAPTIEYFQQDGTTALSKVTLSPWTAYTSSAPALSGMEADGGFVAILPDTLQPFATSFSLDASGALSIEKGANLPEGEHVIGVTATNSGGVSASFDSLFTIKVEALWETEPFITEDFNDEETKNFIPQDAYPGLWSGYVFSGSTGGWKKAHDVGAGGFAGFRMFNPKDTDAGLIRKIDLTDVFGLKINFAEMIGYGGAFTDNYDRALYMGEDTTNVAAGSFVDADWTAIQDTDGAWLEVNWNGGNGPEQYYNINIDLTAISGNTLYLMWRMLPTATSSLDQNGQWIIDSFSATKASAYDAIEE